MYISKRNPIFDHLLESSHRDDSNKWSNIGFCEEVTQVESVEVKFYTSYLKFCGTLADDNTAWKPVGNIALSTAEPD